MEKQTNLDLTDLEFKQIRDRYPWELSHVEVSLHGERLGYITEDNHYFVTKKGNLRSLKESNIVDLLSKLIVDINRAR
jgi:hypothetical protein